MRVKEYLGALFLYVLLCINGNVCSQNLENMRALATLDSVLAKTPKYVKYLGEGEAPMEGMQRDDSVFYAAFKVQEGEQYMEWFFTATRKHKKALFLMQGFQNVQTGNFWLDVMMQVTPFEYQEINFSENKVKELNPISWKEWTETPINFNDLRVLTVTSSKGLVFGYVCPSDDLTSLNFSLGQNPKKYEVYDTSLIDNKFIMVQLNNYWGFYNIFLAGPSPEFPVEFNSKKELLKEYRLLLNANSKEH